MKNIKDFNMFSIEESLRIDEELKIPSFQEIKDSITSALKSIQNKILGSDISPEEMNKIKSQFQKDIQAQATSLAKKINPKDLVTISNALKNFEIPKKINEEYTPSGVSTTSDGEKTPTTFDKIFNFIHGILINIGSIGTTWGLLYEITLKWWIGHRGLIPLNISLYAKFSFVILLFSFLIQTILNILKAKNIIDPNRPIGAISELNFRRESYYGNIKNFGDYVNESYDSILEGKEHKFADSAYRKIADDLSDLYDISDDFYNNILHMAISYYDKKKDAATIADFMSAQKAKLDKLIEAEKKKAEKKKNKDIKTTKGKDYEKDPLPEDDDEEEDD